MVISLIRLGFRAFRNLKILCVVLRTRHVWQTDCVQTARPMQRFGHVVQIRLGNLLFALSIAWKVRHEILGALVLSESKPCWWLSSSTDEFTGSRGKDFAKGHPRVWQCSNQQPADGGLICCDITESDEAQKNSCCSGTGAINLFSIGSDRGGAPVSSIPLSRLSSTLPTNSLSWVLWHLRRHTFTFTPFHP